MKFYHSVVIFLIIAVMASSGCTTASSPHVNQSTPTPSPVPTYVPASITYPPATFGNDTLYGKLTVNGNTPVGTVKKVPASNNNNTIVDAIGYIEVESDYFYSQTGPGQIDAASVPVTSYIDPQGNYRIEKLNSGRALVMKVELFGAAEDGSSKYIYLYYANRSFIWLNITKPVSYCEMDVTCEDSKEKFVKGYAVLKNLQM